MDKLEISSLRVAAHIGVHPWEQRVLQRLLIDISIPIDASICNDEIKNTLDYAQLCEQVVSFIESNPFKLIETLAEQLAQFIKQQFQITQVAIRVSKPDAVALAGNISVNITR